MGEIPAGALKGDENERELHRKVGYCSTDLKEKL